MFAETILKSDWVRPNKRIFNNAKVSDHFAIIPTQLAPKNLEGDELKMYEFVTKRFLAVFFPPAEFQVTTRITRVEEEPFKTEGKVMINPGWMAVYGRDLQDDDSTPSLPKVTQGEKCRPKWLICWDFRPSRRRVFQKQPCSPQWRVRASWWMMRSCARP